ncbi:MAG: hypothetical protein AAF417_12775 [Pseudomonadota bacterium]
MKLRIRDNSVRLRLSQSEVAHLNECGAVSAQTSFPGQSRLAYTVQTGPDRAAARAVFANDAIVVTFPGADVARWADSQEVTLRAEVDTDLDILVVLVEKDFACLSPRAEEDESDMFPHPEAGDRTC